MTLTETNAHFAKHNALFQKACALAKLPATPRQAAKWRRGEGRAYEYKHEAEQVMKEEGK